jgi:hypothetical protein
MGLFSRKKKGPVEDNKEKTSTISKLLDDLTTLEINTIIKRGMVAAPMPQSIEEILQQIFINYKWRLNIIFNSYDEIDKEVFNFKEAKSVEEFDSELKKLGNFMVENNFKLSEIDYVRYLRMRSFCDYIYSKGDDSKPDDNIEVKPYAEGLSKNIYKLDMTDYTKYRLIMFVSDRVKIKRMFDLGTENIVLQTRFALDGDVVTRIEESFANAPKQVVLSIHDKQTELTVNYWKSLVGMVKDFVNELIS